MSSDFFLHRRVKLYNTQGALAAEKDLLPPIAESKLPHCIIWDVRVFLLVERGSCVYHEVIPLLIKDPSDKYHTKAH